MILGVAGMVGAGKSTLTRALAARFGLQLALESVDEDNPWLEKFYDGPEGMRTHALQLQLHFLATRFASLRRMRGTGGSWILDRTWYEDAEIFARGLHDQGLLGDDDWQLYRQLYRELLYSPAARPPRLLIYLYAPLPVILERIQRRGRAMEKDTPEAYWAQLHERYETWVAGFRYCPVLFLDVRDYDLQSDPAAIEALADRVRLQLEGELPQTELWPARAG
ncbi:MAG: deoxynucleoside kinase [Gemmatimonadetes bacterium]|nr:deoxynucleoside kinase [Gemmatimonadota bacterium]